MQSFHSVIFNQSKNKRYDKCEECRALQATLKTNHLVNGDYVYGQNKERFLIDRGNAIKACAVHTCHKMLPCPDHEQDDLSECSSQKCNNCYIKNGRNQCANCIAVSAKSKNATRNKVKDFKVELGGRCFDCGFDELFYLEFDHVDETKKTIQVTRSCPSKWESEKSNLELRCGRCHRMKTSASHNIQPCQHSASSVCKEDKKLFVRQVKQAVGCCQVCKWTTTDKDKMCAALDFDHVTGIKYKQISRLYKNKKETIAEEIKKTRLLCRHCHELHTCFQRGGVTLQFYFSNEQITTMKDALECEDRIAQCQAEIRQVLLSLGY
jgi:hypothetical protein